MERKSFSGHVFILGRAAISRRSQKQRTVALTSTEAEYVSLSDAVKETVYLIGLLDEIGVNSLFIITLYVDNHGAK